MTNGLVRPESTRSPGATPYLRMFGTVVGGWLMARQALAARTSSPSGSTTTAYLEAKVTTARFYAEQLLPQAAGLLPADHGRRFGPLRDGPDTLASV